MRISNDWRCLNTYIWTVNYLGSPNCLRNCRITEPQYVLFKKKIGKIVKIKTRKIDLIMFIWKINLYSFYRTLLQGFMVRDDVSDVHLINYSITCVEEDESWEKGKYVQWHSQGLGDMWIIIAGFRKFSFHHFVEVTREKPG